MDRSQDRYRTGYRKTRSKRHIYHRGTSHWKNPWSGIWRYGSLSRCNQSAFSFCKYTCFCNACPDFSWYLFWTYSQECSSAWSACNNWIRIQRSGIRSIFNRCLRYIKCLEGRLYLLQDRPSLDLTWCIHGLQCCYFKARIHFNSIQ